MESFKLINFEKVIGHEGLRELYVVNGKISKSDTQSEKSQVIDCSSCIVAPGFIDAQVNGLGDCNFWTNPSFDEIDKLRKELAVAGTVGFFPTIITNSKENVVESINHINKYIKERGLNSNSGAKILGIHVEGIFISKYGVHEEKDSISKITKESLDPFLLDNVRLFTVAPELDETGDAVKYLKENNILVSAGHTNGSYADGMKAIDEYGIDLATHMFNAMKGVQGFVHRDFNSLDSSVLKQKLDDDKYIDPKNDGIMLALLKSKQVTSMVISDGVHVSDEAVRVLNEYKSVDNFALVSDVVARDFYLEHKAKGSLGGGQSTLDKCVKNIIKWQVRNQEEALISASKPISQKFNSLLSTSYGEITLDNEAALTIWDVESNTVKGTIIGTNAFIS